MICLGLKDEWRAEIELQAERRAEAVIEKSEFLAMLPSLPQCFIPHTRGERRMTRIPLMRGHAPMAWRHGTPYGYQIRLCRCPDCRRAWAAYRLPRNRAYRARLQAAG